MSPRLRPSCSRHSNSLGIVSHANRVRPLIGGMKMCSLCSYGALLGILVFSSTIAVGQNDPLIESLRPKVIFSEDFEKYAIGTQAIDGSSSEVGGDRPGKFRQCGDTGRGPFLTKKTASCQRRCLCLGN